MNEATKDEAEEKQKPSHKLSTYVKAYNHFPLKILREGITWSGLPLSTALCVWRINVRQAGSFKRLSDG